ncbi:hypothetical protein tb265_22220 [Gemmatimonadetes bacterium T265]|nr:hypothetical protein tb265_22220 [Gemmatimonadetes bacterium T265]
MTRLIAGVLLTVRAHLAPAATPTVPPRAPPAAGREVRPVLAFPEAGLDDSAAYAGYQTRLYRDAAENTVQVYFNGRDGRVVTLLADAENESVGFTARDASGRPAALRWEGPGATVTRTPRGGRGTTRSFTYRLAADGPLVRVGLFVLNSMRVEREFQDLKRQQVAFGGAPYRVAEFDSLLDALAQLPTTAQRQHLALLGAADLATLRSRVQPQFTLRAPARPGAGAYVARVVQSSLDGRDTLALEFHADAGAATIAREGDTFTLQSRGASGGAGAVARVPFTVTVTTTGRTLTPLARGEIFTPDFLAFVDGTRAAAARPDATDSVRLQARVLERQVRGVELLASREQFMAGLPTYATYFGRDQLMTALMMRPIWRDAALEVVIGSVLRGLSPAGAVSHEEAIGQQAVREAAVQYARLVRAGSLDSARRVLADARRTRENYVMVDTDFQVPILVARWITDPQVPAARKRAFLLGAADAGGGDIRGGDIRGGDTRLTRLLRELARVARRTAAYTADSSVAHLVDFPSRAPGQYTGLSWRDSRVGYANGKYAYDVNAVWVPHALEATGRILGALPGLGIATPPLLASSPELAAGTALGTYARDSAALGRAVRAWRGAERHFVVRLGPAEVRADVAARLGAMPENERAYWEGLLARSGADRDSLTFVAVSLDENGRPIGIANTDPATRLFLGDTEAEVASPGEDAAARVRRDVGLFVRDYPVGLYVARVGPVVANDAYAPPAVWEAFARDPYHGPRVVWGREANLFVLGAANHVAAAPAGPLAGAFRSAMARVLGAVAASGFRSELWSYEFRDGRPAAVRYGTAGDVQLWSTSDLAVQYALARLPR